jgi:membrane-associated PAP2 superfamily phosphatase
MRLIPWVALIFAAAVIFNPVGFGFLRNAFWSNELLSRNIAKPIVFIALAILVSLALLEVLVRYWRLR